MPLSGRIFERRGAFRLAMLVATFLFPAGCNAPPLHSTGSPPAAVGTAPSAERASDSANWTTDARTDQPHEKALYHQVRAGESLEDVARTYGMTSSRLLQVNGLDAADGLKPGQLIYIPRSR